MASLPGVAWEVKTEDVPEGTRVFFTSRDIFLDEVNTDRVGAELFRLVEEEGRCKLLIDFENVAYLTSNTLGMLLMLHKKLQTVGGHLVLLKVLPHIYEIFSVTNLTRLLDIRLSSANICASK